MCSMSLLVAYVFGAADLQYYKHSIPEIYISKNDNQVVYGPQYITPTKTSGSVCVVMTSTVTFMPCTHAWNLRHQKFESWSLNFPTTKFALVNSEHV